MGTAIALDPRKSPRQQRSEQTVAVLLQATARVLVDTGWDRASTNRIARAAGVSVGSLYQYFPNKESLVLALARRHAEEVVEMLAAHVGDLVDAPPEEAVPAFVRAMIAAHRVDPELHLALTRQVLDVGLDALDPVQEQARALVVGWLLRHREPLLPTDLEAAAWMCVTTTEAAVHGALLERKGRIEDPALERELSALLLRYLFG